ncbi:MAG: hypothetical protein IKZ43_08110 [Acidaminococcaceae bacterium]|nr:hypothetical protein [Acidaminococcaceae bacterium]
MDSNSGKNRKLKILIMSAPIGSGHRMAAAALEEALLRLENVEVVQGNVFDFFPSWLGSAFLKFYGNVLRFCPSLYAFSYRWSNQGGGSLWMRNRINSVLLHLGKGFISGVKPDVVFSTHATPTGILSLYKQKYDAKLWLGVVVTDFTVHRWLVCPDVDAYFVADEKLVKQIGENKNVLAFGIPVRTAFTEQRDIAAVRKEVRKSFGWPADAFVCLLAGGGGGMLPMEDILGRLCGNKYDTVHAVAVAGHNEVLRKKLEALQKGSLYKEYSASRLAVLGFTDAMPQLMQAADVVITKAGGVSLAECLACGANILIYHPLPGQEQGNTAFLQKEYGVAVVTDLRQLDEYLEREIKVPFEERLHRQEERQQQYGHPDAAQQIAELTEKLCHFNTI